MSIEQFVPGASDRCVEKDTMKKVAEALAPGIDFETEWAAFTALRERVNYPRRRIGGGVTRRGRILRQ